VSLVLVPIATVAIAVAIVLAKRRIPRLERRVVALGPRSHLAAAALGGAGAFAAIGAYALFAHLPNSHDRNAPVNSYQRTADERKIVVWVTAGRNDQILGSSAREDANSVVVAVHLRGQPGWGFNDLLGIGLPVVITLRDPLGDRGVIDERSNSRLFDPAARSEVGVVEGASVRSSAGALDFRWSDATGGHALSDLLGVTVVLVSRGAPLESKMSLGALESYLARATNAERARIMVLVISFDRRDVVAPVDDRFRALFVSPSDLASDAPEILRPSGGAVLWVIAADGMIRERITGRAASNEDVARALAAAR
jgi:hypothetical protein